MKGKPVFDRQRDEGLTARQVEVLQLVAQGLTNAQISARMFISTKMVEKHLGQITDKLGVHGRAALVAQALRRGWMR